MAESDTIELDPRTYAEAVDDVNTDHWVKAMESE
jgi:hypothetical protein